MQRRLVILHGQAIVRLRATICRAISVWQPIASMVTMAPDNSSISSSFGNGRDLIALGVDDDLSQADVIGGRPGADHVNGRLAVGRVEAAAERLAVDGDHLPIGDFVQGRDPTQQTLLELRRLDGGEDRIETIMRRDAGLQVQKPCQPLALLVVPNLAMATKSSAPQITAQTAMTTTLISG